jgi:hypothetical protein
MLEVELHEVFDIHAGREKTLRKFPPPSASKAPSTFMLAEKKHYLRRE